MKYVGTIDETYNVADEPWFVQKLYLPLFVIIFVTVWILYLKHNWSIFRTEQISKQKMSLVVNTVFIPLFIFALSFKAINIQVLAWFTPFCALQKKKELLIEYSLLTLIHGAAIVLFTITADPLAFSELITQSAAEGTISYAIFIRPLLWLQTNTTSKLWVAVIFVTILWYLLRTTIAFGKEIQTVFFDKKKTTLANV
jgi:hypothetical protein